MTDTIGENASQYLRSFVERIERLEEERKGLGVDIRVIYSKAKDAGFDTKALRKIIAERRMKDADRHELNELLDLYRHALGMLDGTPLGDAAVKKATKKLGDSLNPGESIQAGNAPALVKQADGTIRREARG